jgi:hypothetical protein
LWVQGRGFFFQVVVELWCGEWTVHLDGWQLAFHFFVWGVGAVKPKSSQVSDLFPKEFPIAPYFYPICFGKCCPPFIYIPGPKGRNSIIRNRTFYCFLASMVSFAFNITSLWDSKHLPIGWRIVLSLLSAVNKPSKCACKGIDDKNARFTNFDKNRS